MEKKNQLRHGSNTSHAIEKPSTSSWRTRHLKNIQDKTGLGALSSSQPAGIEPLPLDASALQDPSRLSTKNDGELPAASINQEELIRLMEKYGVSSQKSGPNRG